MPDDLQGPASPLNLLQLNSAVPVYEVHGSNLVTHVLLLVIHPIRYEAHPTSVVVVPVALAQVLAIQVVAEAAVSLVHFPSIPLASLPISESHVVSVN